MKAKILNIALLSLLLLFPLTVTGEAPVKTSGSISTNRGNMVRVTIDPGHGGYDPGVIASGVREKDVNLEIARFVKQLSSKHPTLEITLTRTTDDYISLLDRLEIAEENGSSAYLSIHANSFGDPDVNGAEILLDNSRSRGSYSWSMSQLIQSSLIDLSGAKDRGIRYQRLYTRHTSLPAAVLEVGFLTSPFERSNLIDPQHQKIIARGIIRGLLSYFSS